MRVLKWLFAAGLLVELLLCVLAWACFKERMTLPDDANYLFELLSGQGGFAVFHNRFIAVPTQLLPWLGIRANASLETVCRLYSLNLELFQAACYLGCGVLLRNYRLAIGCLLAHILIVTDTFFWSVSELPMCLALLFPLAALLEAPVRRPRIRAAGLALLATTIAFGHSLALFATGFGLAWMGLLRPERRRGILLTSGFYVAALILKAAYFGDPYDRGALGGLRNFVRLAPNYLDTPGFRELLTRFGSDFIWLPLGLIGLIAWLLVRRQRRAALLLAGTSSGYVLLVAVCFPGHDPARFYPENLVLPLAFFPVFAFATSVLQGPGPRAWLLLALAFIAGSAVFRIVQTRDRYRERLAWQRSVIREFRGQKVILPEAAVAPERYLLSWSSPYEFWLLSSLETDSAASIVISKQPEAVLARIGGERKAFLPAFGMYYYEQLPQRYFPFRDTVNAYRAVQESAAR